MCLLDNLILLKEELLIKEIVVAHVNHMLREEAKSETEYVEEYCKKKNIKCFTKFIDIKTIASEEKIGTEEAGRNERYKFFDEVATKIKANKIAVAHNQKDNCETVLMHLLRGSGVAGLAGIKPYSQGKYIRPLIKCSREEIEQYCKQQNLEPKYDNTNNDNTYTRNRIRNSLIPYIQKEFNPNIIKTVERLSELIADEEEYMEKQTKQAYKDVLIKEEIQYKKLKNKMIDGSYNFNNIEDNKVILDLKKFNSLDYIIKTRLIMHTIKRLLGTSKEIEKKNVEDIIKLCGNNIGNKFIMPNKNVKVLVKDRKIYFIENNLI